MLFIKWSEERHNFYETQIHIMQYYILTTYYTTQRMNVRTLGIIVNLTNRATHTTQNSEDIQESGPRMESGEEL